MQSATGMHPAYLKALLAMMLLAPTGAALSQNWTLDEATAHVNSAVMAAGRLEQTDQTRALQSELQAAADLLAKLRAATPTGPAAAPVPRRGEMAADRDAVRTETQPPCAEIPDYSKVSADLQKGDPTMYPDTPADSITSRQFPAPPETQSPLGTWLRWYNGELRRDLDRSVPYADFQALLDLERDKCAGIGVLCEIAFRSNALALLVQPQP